MSETSKAFAALEPSAPLVPHVITRRAPTATDVVIDIKYSGICHSDIHQAREEWGKATFPMVPGHEIVGVVRSVGSDVTRFATGDRVGVGVFVDSCRECAQCAISKQQFCSSGFIGTYNAKAKYPHMAEYNEDGGAVTYGGYSDKIVVDQLYVCTVPASLDFAGAAPLLCAGITTYSPIRRFGLNSTHKFAVLGLGGLGHMGVKFGLAMGAHTTVISRGTAKKQSALEDLKASAFLDSTNEEEMAAAKGSFDFILDCVAADHDIAAMMALLKPLGCLCLVGLPSEVMKIHAFSFVVGAKSITGSIIGGIEETQEMLDFCAEKGITSDVEVISADKINEAYERAVQSDVKYRFVIDASTF